MLHAVLQPQVWSACTSLVHGFKRKHAHLSFMFGLHILSSSVHTSTYMPPQVKLVLERRGRKSPPPTWYSRGQLLAHFCHPRPPVWPLPQDTAKASSQLCTMRGAHFKRPQVPFCLGSCASSEARSYNASITWQGLGSHLAKARPGEAQGDCLADGPHP
eukprot:scaffold60931_cov24-Tisochrysis_lutea.AAC.3